MPGHNIVAVYDTPARAQEARRSLIASGLDSQEIRLSSETSRSGSTAAGEGRDEPGFFYWLFGTDVSEDDRSLYRTELRDGRTVVSVYAPDGKSAVIEDVLERFDPIEIKGDGAATGAQAARPAATRGRDEQVIPVTKEELNVGKETEERRFRIRTYAVETPVERNVNLRDERVIIERRPVSGDAQAGTVSAQPREFEMIERHQRPVVDKKTRQVEEVVVHKEASEHTEKIADTVRETRVDVDKTGQTTGKPRRTTS